MTTKGRAVLLLPAVAMLFAISFLGSTLIHGSAFGFAASTTTSQYLEVATATLCGILVSIVVSGLRQLRPDQRVRWATLVDLLARPGSLVAFLVSPLVLYGTFVASGTQEVNAAALLAAFQNGFFWQQVLKRAPDQS